MNTQLDKPKHSISRVLPNKWSYMRKRRTAARLRAKHMPEKVIKEQVWGKW